MLADILASLAGFVITIAWGVYCYRVGAREYRRRWKEALAVIERMDDGGIRIERTITELDRRVARAVIGEKKKGGGGGIEIF